MLLIAKKAGYTIFICGDIGCIVEQLWINFYDGTLNNLNYAIFSVLMKMTAGMCFSAQYYLLINIKQLVKDECSSWYNRVGDL